MPLYDAIGTEYSQSRPADERIVRGLCNALQLPPGSTLLDVGAGTGKYARALADCGYRVLAIEPSTVMREQSVPHPAIKMIPASAEYIPLAAGEADGAYIVLALHHFDDRRRALREILRVIGRGPLVIFSFEPSAFHVFGCRSIFPDWDMRNRTRLRLWRTWREKWASSRAAQFGVYPFLCPAILRTSLLPQDGPHPSVTLMRGSGTASHRFH